MIKEKSPSIPHRIKRVYVENYCGTYCVFIEDVTGDQLKVAHIDMLVFEAQKKAKAYAKRVEKVLKGTA